METPADFQRRVGSFKWALNTLVTCVLAAPELVPALSKQHETEMMETSDFTIGNMSDQEDKEVRLFADLLTVFEKYTKE